MERKYPRSQLLQEIVDRAIELDRRPEAYARRVEELEQELFRVRRDLEAAIKVVMRCGETLRQVREEKLAEARELELRAHTLTEADVETHT